MPSLKKTAQAVSDDRELITLHTAAPIDYDGFSTTTVRVVGRDNRRGQPIREITVQRRDYAWQTGRYDSGMCAYTNSRMTLADYVRFGDWTLVGSWNNFERIQ